MPSFYTSQQIVTSYFVVEANEPRSGKVRRELKNRNARDAFATRHVSRIRNGTDEVSRIRRRRMQSSAGTVMPSGRPQNSRLGFSRNPMPPNLFHLTSYSYLDRQIQAFSGLRKFSTQKFISHPFNSATSEVDIHSDG